MSSQRLILVFATQDQTALADNVRIPDSCDGITVAQYNRTATGPLHRHAHVDRESVPSSSLSSSQLTATCYGQACAACPAVFEKYPWPIMSMKATEKPYRRLKGRPLMESKVAALSTTSFCSVGIAPTILEIDHQVSLRFIST